MVSAVSLQKTAGVGCTP